MVNLHQLPNTLCQVIEAMPTKCDANSPYVQAERSKPAVGETQRRVGEREGVGWR